MTVIRSAFVDSARAIRSQRLRLRGAGVWLPVLGIPALASGLAALVLWAAESGVGEEGDPWGQVIEAAFGLWSILLLPLLVALVAAQVATAEHAARGWKHLFALPVWKGAHVVAAWVAVAALTAAATAGLAVGVAGVGTAVSVLRPDLALPPAPLRDLLGAVAVVYAGALALVSGHLWLSLRWPSVGVGLGVAVGGVLTNVVLLNLGGGAVTPYGVAPMALMSGQPGLALLGLAGGVVLLLGAVAHLSRRDAPA
ncbi:MAG: ABC transporter permease [Bacteroidota bacterium]